MPLDLFVEGFATDDPFLGFKEGAVFRIEFTDCDLAALRITLTQHFKQIPLHQVTKRVAH